MSDHKQDDDSLLPILIGAVFIAAFLLFGFIWASASRPTTTPAEYRGTVLHDAEAISEKDGHPAERHADSSLFRETGQTHGVDEHSLGVVSGNEAFATALSTAANDTHGARDDSHGHDAVIAQDQHAFDAHESVGVETHAAQAAVELAAGAHGDDVAAVAASDHGNASGTHDTYTSHGTHADSSSHDAHVGLVNESKSTIDQLGKSLFRRTQRTSKLESQIIALRANLLAKNSAMVESQRTASEFADLQSQLTDAANRLEESQKKLAIREQQYADLQARLGEKEQLARAAETRTTKLKEEVDGLLAEITKRDDSLAKARLESSSLVDSRAAAFVQIEELEKKLGQGVGEAAAFEAELGLARKALADREQKLDAATQRITELTGAIAEKTKLASQLEAERNTARVALKDRDERLLTASKKTESLSAELEAIQSSVAEHETALADLKKANTDTESRYAIAKERVRTLETELGQRIGTEAALKTDLKSARNALAELRGSLTDKQASVTELQTNNSSLTKARDAAVNKFTEVKASLAELQSQQQKITATLEDTMARNKRLSQEREAAQAESKRLTQELSASRDELAAAKETEASLAAELSKARAEALARNEELERDLEASRQVASTLKTDLARANEELIASRGRLNERLTELQKKTEQISSVSEDLAGLKTELADRNAAITQLQNDQQNLVRTRDETVNRLKEKTEAATALADDLERTRTSLHETKSTLEVLQAEQKALVAARDDAESRVMTLRNQVAERKEAEQNLQVQLATAREEARKQTGLIQTKGDSLTEALVNIEKLRGTIAVNEKDYETLQKEQEELVDAFEQSKQRVVDLRSKLAAREKDVTDLETQLVTIDKKSTEKAISLQGQNTDLRNRLEQRMTEIDSFKTDLATANEQLATSSANLQAKTEVADALSLDLARLKGVLDEKETAYDKLQQESTRLTIALDDANENIAAMEKELEVRQQRAKELRSQLSQAKQEVVRQTEKLAAKTEEASQVANELEQVQSNLDSTRNQLVKLKVDYMNVLAARDDAQVQAATLRTKLANADDKVTRLDGQVSELLELTKRPSSFTLMGGESGAWDLSGEVADASTKSAVERCVQEVFGDEQISSRIVINDRIKPSPWVNGLRRLLRSLNDADVTGLGVQIKSDTVEINGLVRTEAERLAVEQSINALSW